MRKWLVECWHIVMDSSHNPLHNLGLASQHVVMQALAWMWSMLFSLAFLSIFQFGLVWLAHMLVIAGIVITVSTFHYAERRKPEQVLSLSNASPCVWQLDKEA